MVREKEKETMKVKVQGQELKVGFDAYMALKNENEDLEVVSYSDYSVEDQYTDELMKCKIFIAHINKLMNLLPSPDRAIYTDYSSAYAMRKHLDMVYDMLTSWTGFECNND